MTERTDDDLMAASGNGDFIAFEELILRHQRWVWTIASNYLKDRHHAEDIARRAFLKLLDAAPRYERRGQFKAYLRSVVTRLCLDYGKKRKPEELKFPEAIESPQNEPLEEMLAREHHWSARQALRKVPDKQRMALVLRYFDGLSYQEIAETLQVSPKAVEGLLARGREKLHDLLSR